MLVVIRSGEEPSNKANFIAQLFGSSSNTRVLYVFRREKEKFKDLRKEYYETVGWDENGIPKSETLKKLGLEDVDNILRHKYS